MKKMILTSENENRQFAFVKGNRPTNAKTVKAKEKSIKEYGQLSPITVVKGEDVYLMDGHLVDLDGNDIPDDQTENYYAVLDGQHRLVAYLNLKLNLDDLVICEPLNVEMSIAALIAEMNICTKTWTGTDYMAAPAMMLGNKNEVFELVRTDWEFAYENLPEKDDDGFATKWAAKAYLGKLYHTLGCQGDNTAWEKAKACFDEVMPKYRLADKFSDLFVDYVQGSPESIFQLNFALAGSTTRNRGSWLVAPNGSCNGQAWDRIRASKALYDYFLATYPGDPRIESTFLTYWKSYAGVGKGEKPKEEPIASARDTVYAYPYFTYTIEGEEKPAGWKKPKLYVGRIPYEKLADPASPKAEELYAMIADTATATPAEKGYLKGLLSLLENATKKPSTNTKSWPYFKKPWDPEQSGNNSHKNLILYRYADMLLMAADVYNELGQTDKAITLANEVLKRARQSGNASQPADWKSGLSKEQVREKIYFERIFEGAGEPEMYQKMRLRGTELLKKAFEVNNGHGIIQESVANNPKGNGNWGERIFNDGNLNDENFLKKNLLLPVPKDEIDTNSALDYSDNNYGYTN